jgi:glucan phosphoethanolaminetransferase (alkaline phosphatase superfamily)
MSRKAGTDTTRLFGEKSILSAFKEAGFKTYFLSNQAQPGGLRSTIGLFSQEADISVSTNHSSNDITGKSQFDQALVEQFNQLTADTSIAKFFVIHTIGSHDAYNKRYPDRFNRFSPSLSDMPNKNYHDDSNKELAVNAYDNSVLYTDYILKSIIDRLAAATKIGALMYVSDHGEVLFDGSCNFLGHGSRHAPNFPVASLVWVTEGYRKAHPENLEQIKLNSIKKLTTENTFPSLLGIAGIDFLGLDKTMSISSHIFKERSRYVHAGKVVDWDNAEFIGPCQTVQSR